MRSGHRVVDLEPQRATSQLLVLHSPFHIPNLLPNQPQHHHSRNLQSIRPFRLTDLVKNPRQVDLVFRLPKEGASHAAAERPDREAELEGQEGAEFPNVSTGSSRNLPPSNSIASTASLLNPQSWLPTTTSLDQATAFTMVGLPVT